jgi:hypothetical protein
MVKDHKEDLKEFQKEAQAAQDPNVKMIAEQGQKVISQHLQLIEQIGRLTRYRWKERKCPAGRFSFEWSE